MNNPYLIQKKKEKKFIFIMRILIFILFLLIWEVLSRFKIIDSFLFSSPTKIYQTFKEYLVNGEIFSHILISLLETLTGLIIGTISGLLIAIILWLFKKIHKILDPFLVVLNALPKTALAPIIIIWIGMGFKGIVAVSISITIIITIISAFNYFNQIEEEKIRMLKSFKATKIQILTKLIIPSNFLNILNIIKINIGMSWVGVIIGEFIVSQKGIGHLLMYGGQVFNLHLVMMGVIILAILSYLMSLIIDIIEKKFKRR